MSSSDSANKPSSSHSSPSDCSSVHPFQHPTNQIVVLRENIDVEEESRLYNELCEVHSSTFQSLCYFFLLTESGSRMRRVRRVQKSLGFLWDRPLSSRESRFG